MSALLGHEEYAPVAPTLALKFPIRPKLEFLNYASRDLSVPLSTEPASPKSGLVSPTGSMAPFSPNATNTTQMLNALLSNSEAGTGANTPAESHEPAEAEAPKERGREERRRDPKSKNTSKLIAMAMKHLPDIEPALAPEEPPQPLARPQSVPNITRSLGRSVSSSSFNRTGGSAVPMRLSKTSSGTRPRMSKSNSAQDIRAKAKLAKRGGAVLTEKNRFHKRLQTKQDRKRASRAASHHLNEQRMVLQRIAELRPTPAKDTRAFWDNADEDYIPRDQNWWREGLRTIKSNDAHLRANPHLIAQRMEAMHNTRFHIQMPDTEEPEDTPRDGNKSMLDMLQLLLKRAEEDLEEAVGADAKADIVVHMEKVRYKLKKLQDEVKCVSVCLCVCVSVCLFVCLWVVYHFNKHNHKKQLKHKTKNRRRRASCTQASRSTASTTPASRSGWPCRRTWCS